MTVSFNDYINDLADFSNKHNAKADCKVYTSPMEDNRYHKERCWSDGATWYEVTELVEEDVEIEKHGLKFFTTISFWKTEYWTTESPSKYFYERAK